MFCGECGTRNPDTNQFCKNCGKPLRRPRQVTAPQPAAAPVPLSTTQLPPQAASYPPQPAAMPPPGATAGVPAPVKPPLNKGMLVLGIVGILAGIGSWFRYPYLLGILAIVSGVIVVAKSEKKTSAAPIIAALGILIGLACIVVDVFYFTFFPIPPLNL